MPASGELKTAFIVFILNHIVARVPVRRFRMALYGLCFSLAPGSNILMGVRFRYRRHLILGVNSVINYGSTIDTRGGEVVIGDYVDLAPEVNVWTLEHDPQDPSHAARGERVVIDDYAWVANRAVILPGVTIGRGAVVAAGAVVTKSVAPFAIVAGVPARQIGRRQNQTCVARPPYRSLFQ